MELLNKPTRSRLRSPASAADLRHQRHGGRPAWSGAVTRWARDPYSLGSHSAALPGQARLRLSARKARRGPALLRRRGVRVCLGVEPARRVPVGPRDGQDDRRTHRVKCLQLYFEFAETLRYAHARSSLKVPPQRAHLQADPRGDRQIPSRREFLRESLCFSSSMREPFRVPTCRSSQIVAGHPSLRKIYISPSPFSMRHLRIVSADLTSTIIPRHRRSSALR